MSETMIFLLILGGSHMVSSRDFIDANYKGRLRTRFDTTTYVDYSGDDYSRLWIQLT